MTFEKFTLKAQDSIAIAQQIALEFGNQQIEPEHILLALIKDKEGLIPTIIKKSGVDLNIVLASIEHEVKKIPKVQGSGFGQIQLSNRSQNLINNAFKKTNELKDDFVSTEHLLLAILVENDGNGGKPISANTKVPNNTKNIGLRRSIAQSFRFSFPTMPANQNNPALAK